MNIDAIAVGFNPPEDINVIVEVPIGGEPIKYEMNKSSGSLFVDKVSLHSDEVPRKLRVCARIRFPTTGIQSTFSLQIRDPYWLVQ
jgi:inorganic pyrophosphatase